MLSNSKTSMSMFSLAVAQLLLTATPAPRSGKGEYDHEADLNALEALVITSPRPLSSLQLATALGWGRTVTKECLRELLGAGRISRRPDPGRRFVYVKYEANA